MIIFEDGHSGWMCYSLDAVLEVAGNSLLFTSKPHPWDSSTPLVLVRVAVALIASCLWSSSDYEMLHIYFFIYAKIIERYN